MFSFSNFIIIFMHRKLSSVHLTQVSSEFFIVCLFSLAMRATDLGLRILPLQWWWISAVIELVLIASTSVAREPLSLSQPV